MTTAAASRVRLILPQSGWRLVVLASLLLLLRKSWALHTPQLYAEDGSIFLAHDDEHGIRAWWDPYMGYLHLLPRMIAWIASNTADVAWWPAIYNGLSFAITVGVFARLASPRVDVPGKPWLAVAFAFLPHTGEVLFNITNLQWVTAFYLLLQVIMTRPATLLARIVDLAIVFVVGLTGPFALVFLPLFAWRWWRERNGDTLAALLTVAVCAAIQSAFILRSSQIALLEQPMASSPLMFAAVLGTRLIAWPFLGASAARALPLPVLAVLGSVGLTAILAWTLRPHARRGLRVPVVAALVLVLAVSMIRLRPDTWDRVDLVNGERYFFIPRVLLAWLLIWEFDSASRAVAIVSRAICLIGAVANLPGYILPAPPNYHWAENCDPIRRGVPAKIHTLPEGWWIDYPGRPGRN